MKKSFIFILALFVLACNERKVNSNVTTSDEVSLYGIPPTEASTEALQSILQRFAGQQTKSAAPRPTSEIFRVLSSPERYTFTQCPYYRLNIETFYKDLSPEKILRCLYVPQDEIYYIGEQEGKVVFNLVLTKVNSQWELNFGEDWDKVIGWLPEKIMKADSKEYKIFKVDMQEYVTYTQNEKPVYHRITGEEISPETLCENIVDLINNTRN